MCYYNSIIIPKKKSIKFFDKEIYAPEIIKPLQNGFEYANYPIIKPLINNDWTIEDAHWEFIPSWINTIEKLIENRKKYATLNAKAETLLESKMYREAALTRRCLVLSSGFYEWRHYKPAGEKKEIAYPYYISLKDNSPFFYMAGIYNITVDKESGELITSFAIVTTAANSVMEKIHNTKKRMPTILLKEKAEEWISDISEDRVKELALHQLPSDQFSFHTIAKEFRTATKPAEPFEYDVLTPL